MRVIEGKSAVPVAPIAMEATKRRTPGHGAQQK